jgi:2-C-methyl-D-erythritol 2,4-cyclodiphosphate synthase
VFRIGFGYDVHRLVPGRALILGGVEIPFPLGLDGHSDADVLTHAIMDALVGALGMGDIGRHFPDTDPRYLGADSLTMLKQIVGWTRERGLRLNNLDATVVAQEPRLVPFIPEMQARLARVLETEERRINIKAKTSEGLGFCGRREGMEAFAVLTLADHPEGIS